LGFDSLRYHIFIFFALFGFFIVQSSFSQTRNDKKLLLHFTEDVKNQQLSKNDIYKNYMYTENGIDNRSPEAVKFYTDTLMLEMELLFKKYKIFVSTLKEAKSKYGSSITNNYYYEGQRNSIYIITVLSSVNTIHYYILVHKNKIVSLMPEIVSSGNIYSWK